MMEEWQDHPLSGNQELQTSSWEAKVTNSPGSSHLFFLLAQGHNGLAQTAIGSIIDMAYKGSPVKLLYSLLKELRAIEASVAGLQWSLEIKVAGIHA